MLKIEIDLPEKIKARMESKKIILENGKKIEKEFHTKKTSITIKENKIILSTKKETKSELKEINTIESHIKNMIIGMQKEFKAELAILYSHFPISLVAKGNIMEIHNFFGEKKPRKAKIVNNSIIEIKGKQIIVRGNEKEAVSQTAANLEQATKIKKRDIRVFQDGIYLTKAIYAE